MLLMTSALGLSRPSLMLWPRYFYEPTMSTSSSLILIVLEPSMFVIIVVFDTFIFKSIFRGSALSCNTIVSIDNVISKSKMTEKLFVDIDFLPTQFAFFVHSPKAGLKQFWRDGVDLFYWLRKTSLEIFFPKICGTIIKYQPNIFPRHLQLKTTPFSLSTKEKTFNLAK